MTIKQLLIDSCDRRPSSVALRYKAKGSWHELSYRGLMARARCVGEVLAQMKIKRGDRVAIYLPNCPQWPEIYFGIVGVGAVAVPVDAKLHEQEVAHVLRDSRASAVFASAKTYHVLREVEDDPSVFEHVVLIGGRELLPVTSRKVKYRDYEDSMADVQERSGSQDAYFESQGPGEDDIASIIYTSGTTGRQKGAMLSHHNFCADVEASLAAIGISHEDNFLLVLPLHHSFAFTGNLLIPVAAGAEISFIESIKTVSENVREVSPTVVIGVPLLIEKMYARIRSQLRKNRVAHGLYRCGIRSPVIRGIRKKFGGRLKLFVVGGAPSSADVIRGFARLGITVLEGYGLTETAPVLTLNPLSRPKPGTVGKPLRGIEVSIREPDAEGVGEIIARGPNIMQGYYNDPESTRNAFSDGWFLTGDLGFVDEDGYVVITGRKKSLIVNREGKNIHPEEVEGFITASELVLEALVMGFNVPGETGERVGVIVVPDQEALDEYAKRRKHPLTDDEVRDVMRREVQQAGLEMADYKRPRRIQVRTEEFEKTSTGKIKRYLYAIHPSEV